MKTASIFSAFNARWLEPEDVARSFVPTMHFKSLVKFQHSLLMGPRGCGKTTLLKMLTRRAQKIWASRLQEEPDLREYPNPDFEAIYIASDIRWSEELGGIAKTLTKSPQLAEQMQRVLVAISSVIEATRVFQAIVEEQNVDSTELLKAFIRHLDLGPTVPSFQEVRLKLQLWIDELHRLLIADRAVELSARLEEIPPFLAGGAPTAVMRACTIFDEYMPNNSPTKWALCFDELEIAPKWLQTELFKGLRSTDQRFLLKLTWSPLLPSDLTPRQERQHDYATIRMWHGHVLDAKPFCKEFSKRFLQDRFGSDTSLTPRDVFGSSPFASDDLEHDDVYRKGSSAWQAMVRLAAVDTSFERYLVDHNIDPQNPVSDNIRVRDESLRKIKPIVLLREAFIGRAEYSRTHRRSRKNPNLYFGEDAIYAMSEGNPRLLASLLSDLLDLSSKADTARKPQVRSADQSRLLSAASQRALAGIKAYPTKVHLASRSLAQLVDRMGEFLHSELVVREFSPDPIGTFLVDPDLSKEILDELTFGLLIGAFVHVKSHESDIPQSLVGSRIRLSYILSPYYQLLFRNYRDIRLSVALRVVPAKQRSFF